MTFVSFKGVDAATRHGYLSMTLWSRSLVGHQPHAAICEARRARSSRSTDTAIVTTVNGATNKSMKVWNWGSAACDVAVKES
jgi:hypothetical protein